MAASKLRAQGVNIRDFRVFATIPATYRPVYGVACSGSKEAWVSDENETISRIDINGAVKAIFRNLCPTSGISVTCERELIFSDVKNETVNIVRDGQSETLITKFETLFNPPVDLIPKTLCCTRSGYILVHMYKGKDHQRENNVFRVCGKECLNISAEKNPIFGNGEHPLFMSENKNRDVCVSDVNANAVIVVEQTGRVRFRYYGEPAGREKSFRPGGIVTDALSQIIVTDYNNDCLHILDKKLQFLRCIDDCGLENPYGLSVDSEGRLWVGLFLTGKIKVIVYMQNM